MSYKNLNTSDDSLNRLFSNAANFHNMSQNLINAESFEAFQVWFEKLELIDRRMLYMFFKKNHALFKDEFVSYAEKRLRRKVRE